MAPLKEVNVEEFGWGWVAVGKRQLKLLELFFPAPPNSSEPLLCGSGLLDSSVPSLDTSFRKTLRTGPYGSAHLTVTRSWLLGHTEFLCHICLHYTTGYVTTGLRCNRII